MSSIELSARQSVDITRQHSWSETSPTDERPATPDLEGQTKDLLGWIRLVQQHQRDPRHMVAPRCTGIASSLILYRVRRVLGLSKEIQQKSQAGEDVDELQEKLFEEHDKYQRLLLQASQVLGLDQPNKPFLKALLPTWRTLLGPEDEPLFSDETRQDWASLSQPGKLEQYIGRIPSTDVGRWIFRPFLRGVERIGENDMYDYHENGIKAVIFAAFSCIVGVFACAPVAIQSLNVDTVGQEVATYLVFMIVFSWVIQALFRGDEKILLTCIAYSGVLATVMRQGQ